MLAPNLTFRPNGPISPGNIIVDPFKPHRTLSKQDPAIWTPPPTQTVTEHDWRLSLGNNSNFNAKAWAHVAESNGLDVGTDHSRNRGVEYSTGQLDTVYFTEEPSYDTLCKLTQDPAVSLLMKPQSVLCKPVYMITGIKIARGLTWSSDTGRSHGGNMSISADVVPGVSVGVGGGGSSEKTIGKGSTLEGDIVFAYQLLKLVPKGWWPGKRVLAVSEYQSDATFLHDQEDEKETAPVEIQASIPTAEELARLGGKKATLHRLDGEHGLVCISY